MKHWTERAVERALRAFVEDAGMVDFEANPGTAGPDAWARLNGRLVWFEIKSCRWKVNDAQASNGLRSGRFRINPLQHKSKYGTKYLWYVLVVYDKAKNKKGEIVQVQFVRSDKLPQRDTIISLSAEVK